MALIGGSQSGSTTGDQSPVTNIQGSNNVVNVSLRMGSEEIKALAAAIWAEAPASIKGNGPAPAIDAALGQIVSGAQSGDDLLGRALQLIAEKRPAEAEPLLKAVADERAARIAQDRKDAGTAYRSLAAIARLTDPQRALRAYQQAAEYDPEDLESALQAGWLAMSRGDLAQAAGYFRRVQEKTESGRALFWTHIGFGGVFEWQGDISRAAGAYEAAVRLAQQVREKYPDSSEWRHNLRVGLTYYGDAMVRRGQKGEGLSWYLKALALFDSTSPDAPRSTAESLSYAFLVNKVGEQWLGQRDIAGALRAHSAALAIYNDLASSHPGEVEYKRGLMLTYDHLGESMAAAKDWATASQNYQRSIDIAYQLTQADPDNKEAKRDLGLMDIKIGNVLFQNKQPDIALEAYKAGLSFLQKLADGDPENTEWQHDVALGQFRIGTVLDELSRTGEARSALEQSIHISVRLTKRNPHDAGWRKTLRAAVRSLAGTFLTGENGAAALATWETHLRHCESLASCSGAEMAWLEEEHEAYTAMGDIRSGAGERANACVAHRTALAIAERLTVADPDSADWQVMAVVSDDRLASLDDDPKRRCEDMISRLEALQAQGKLYPPQSEWLPAAKGELAKLVELNQTPMDAQEPDDCASVSRSVR
jgi:tetratricopeptide (TPR) repeat protein